MLPASSIATHSESEGHEMLRIPSPWSICLGDHESGGSDTGPDGRGSLSGRRSAPSRTGSARRALVIVVVEATSEGR